MELTDKEREILTQLQRGIALEERPFNALGLAEAEIVQLLQRAVDNGLIRRFGGVFDSHRLGYKSLLCAVDVPRGRVEDVAAVVCRHPGVTHCYERRPLHGGQGYPALWFTLAMLQEHFVEGLEALRGELGGAELLCLPALQRFKIDVVFDLRMPSAGEHNSEMCIESGAAAEVVPLGEGERQMVRLLGDQLALSARPFDAVAGALGIGVAVLLEKLQRWQALGLLRRVAPILHHRRAGFTCNGMCVWPVDGDVAAVGVQLAARSEVTHCYQRPRLPAFPFDLFAMIHAGSKGELEQMYGKIAGACGLRDGEVLLSTREFKKSSMAFFPETRLSGA